MSNPAWLGLLLVAGLPALAEAQLFPNRTVTRQRGDCANEPPFYSTVRRNYFGYYPTCWSRFPAGWGCPCPNPELPNRIAEFERQKRDPLPTLPPNSGLDEGMGADEPSDMPAARPADDPNLPPVPGRRPFERDAPADNIPQRNVPGGAAGAGAGPGGPQTRSTAPAVPAPNPAATSSNDLPPPVTTTSALLEMPRITPPTGLSQPLPNPDAGSLALAPDAMLTSAQPATRPELGPLPAAPLPDPSTPATDAAGVGAIDPSLMGGTQPAPGAAPAQAPQRKGLLGGLFNQSKRRR